MAGLGCIDRRADVSGVGAGYVSASMINVTCTMNRGTIRRHFRGHSMAGSGQADRQAGKQGGREGGLGPEMNSRFRRMIALKDYSHPRCPHVYPELDNVVPSGRAL